jgi:hypothetical protein
MHKCQVLRFTSHWGCCSSCFNTLAFGWWLWQHSTYSDAPVPVQLLQALKVLSMSQYYLYIYSMIIHSQLSLTVQCVPWVHVTMCFISEKCITLCDSDIYRNNYIPQSIQCIIFMVFLVFFKSGVTSWGACAQIRLYPLYACIRMHVYVYRYNYMRYISLMH